MNTDPSLNRLNQRFQEIFGYSALQPPPQITASQDKTDLINMTGQNGLIKKLTRLNNLLIRYNGQIEMMKNYKNPALVKKHLETKKYQELETQIKILIMNILNTHSNDMSVSQKQEFEKNTSQFLDKINNVRNCKFASKESCVISGGKKRKRTTKRKSRKARKTRKHKRVRRKRFKTK